MIGLSRDSTCTLSTLLSVSGVKVDSVWKVLVAMLASLMVIVESTLTLAAVALRLISLGSTPTRADARFALNAVESKVAIEPATTAENVIRVLV